MNLKNSYSIKQQRINAVLPITAILAGLVLSLFSVDAVASELSDILQRMSQADQRQNYQGTFILRKSDQLSSLRVTHGKDEKGAWESMEALNGESQKVIRRNNKVVSIFPERKLVTVRYNKDSKSLHPQLPKNLQKLDFFYSIEQKDDDRIADHKTLVIDLLPRDKLRYGYRYWVDKNTGMLLRCDLVDEDQQVIEQMMFTSLEYLPDAPSQPVNLSQFQHYKQEVLDEEDAQDIIKTRTAPVTSVGKALNSQAAMPSWEINILPKGFMLTQSKMRHSSSVQAENKQKPDLLHMVYSDGLASVSVFIKKQQEKQDTLQGGSSMGTMNAFGNEVDGYAVTVVGEVPMRTVQSMAQSASRLQ